MRERGGSPHTIEWRKETALSDAVHLRNRGARLNYYRPAARAFSRRPDKFNLLETNVASKRLILRHFQKSGREFTGFQKKCPAKFLTRAAGGGRKTPAGRQCFGIFGATRVRRLRPSRSFRPWKPVCGGGERARRCRPAPSRRESSSPARAPPRALVRA